MTPDGAQPQFPGHQPVGMGGTVSLGPHSGGSNGPPIMGPNGQQGQGLRPVSGVVLKSMNNGQGGGNIIRTPMGGQYLQSPTSLSMNAPSPNTIVCQPPSQSPVYSNNQMVSQPNMMNTNGPRGIAPPPYISPNHVNMQNKLMSNGLCPPPNSSNSSQANHGVLLNNDNNMGPNMSSQQPQIGLSQSSNIPTSMSSSNEDIKPDINSMNIKSEVMDTDNNGNFEIKQEVRQYSYFMI